MEKEEKKKKKKVSGIARHAKHAKKHATHAVDNTTHLADRIVTRRDRCVDCNDIHALNSENRCTACTRSSAHNKTLVTVACGYRHCLDVEQKHNATIKAAGRSFCTKECMRHYKKASDEASHMRKNGCSEDAINEMLNKKPVYCTEQASDLFGIIDL